MGAGHARRFQLGAGGGGVCVCVWGGSWVMGAVRV